MVFVRVSPHLWIHICAKKVDYWLSTEDSAGKYVSPFHDIPIYANEDEVSTLQQFFVATLQIPYSDQQNTIAKSSVMI